MCFCNVGISIAGVSSWSSVRHPIKSVNCIWRSIGFAGSCISGANHLDATCAVIGVTISLLRRSGDPLRVVGGCLRRKGRGFLVVCRSCHSWGSRLRLSRLAPWCTWYLCRSGCPLLWVWFHMFLFLCWSQGRSVGAACFYSCFRPEVGCLMCLWAKYMVRVSKHHCGQTFSTYLGRWEGRSPVRRGWGAQPHKIIFDDFWSIFGKIHGLERQNSWKYRI